MRMPSSSGGSHNFAQVPQAKITRSSFDRSSSFKTTFDSGYLVPIFADEVVPGDTFNLKTTTFARLLTPIVPIMDNLYADIFYFFVPNRLLWTNWEKFCGAQDNPGDSISFLIPQMQCPAGGYAIGSLHDYFGLPTVGSTFGGSNQVYHNSLHLRAYNQIWNAWFRDENLQNSVTKDVGDGPDTYSNYTLLKRGKRHDYFTSCLPSPQKGAAVSLPIGTKAYISGLAKYNKNYSTGGTTIYEAGSSTSTTFAHQSLVDPGASDTQFYMRGTANSNGILDVYADLSTASAATINQLRLAFQVQALLERDARGGTRYTEIVQSHFGVTSPDARLQRPEFLGSGSTRITVNPVAQTSGTSASGTTTPLGNLGATATFSHGSAGFNKSFVEHGVIIGLLSVRADLNYQQGLHKMWTRQSRYDFYWPSLAELGEQSVLLQEIYCVGDGASGDTTVFGYQERWAEMRYKPSLITGKFRSTAASTIDIWHLAQKFTTAPTLNSTFISESPPVDRVVAVTSQPQFQLDCYHKLTCARPMPVYSVPVQLGRF